MWPLNHLRLILMTTPISVATRDSIVIGCDSLATISQPMIEPRRFKERFFDEHGELVKDKDGKPLLDKAEKVNAFVQNIPKNQLPNVTKIHQLPYIPAGLLFAGNAGIGNSTIRQIVESFAESTYFMAFKDGTKDYLLAEIASKLSEHIGALYDKEYAEIDKSLRPSMEILLSGYSRSSWDPEIFRIEISDEKSITPELNDRKYNVILGGQSNIIERVVYGLDGDGLSALQRRAEEILNNYRAIVLTKLKEANISFTPPEIDPKDAACSLIGNNLHGVKGIFSGVAGLSEQAAIDFAEFLLTTMIKGQQFSGSIPTVGGAIHMAIISKKSGFKWISKEEYKFQGEAVPKYEN